MGTRLALLLCDWERSHNAKRKLRNENTVGQRWVELRTNLFHYLYVLVPCCVRPPNNQHLAGSCHSH